MGFLYDLLKFIHVMSAITAVGANITYALWIARSGSDSAHTGFALKGIKFIDDRIANPAYIVVFITGVLMVVAGHLSFTTLWIVIAIVLFVVLAVLGFGLYTPSLRDQIKVLDAGAGDVTSAEFTRLGRRNRMLGMAMGLVVVLIVVMMVFQPKL